MILAGSTAAPDISYKGYTGAFATTLTLPDHIADDILLMCAIRFDDSPGTAPSGWTTLRRHTFSYNATGVLAYKVAASDGETSGTWTNMHALMCACYRGPSNVGDYSHENAASGSIWEALTMVVSDGSSWAAGFSGINGATTGMTNAPSGMTYRGIVSSGSNHIVLCDTASGVSSWPRKSTVSNCIESCTFTVELKA